MTHQITLSGTQQKQLEEMLLIIGISAWSKKSTEGVLIYYFENKQQGVSAVSLCRDYIPASFITIYNQTFPDKKLYQLFPISSQFNVFFSFLYSFVTTNSKGVVVAPVIMPMAIQYTQDQRTKIWQMLEWCAWNLWKGAGRGLVQYSLIDGVMVYDALIDGKVEVLTADELLYLVLYKTQFKWNRTFPLDSRSPIHPQLELMDIGKLFLDTYSYVNMLSKGFARNGDGSFLIQLK